MSDWFDEEDEAKKQVALRGPLAAEPADPIDRVRAFDAAWAELPQKQREFLAAWKAARFNIQRTIRENPGIAHRKTVYGWQKDPQFAFCQKLMRIEATGDVLSRERLILRQDDIVETLMTPKPILYQGAPVMHNGVILEEVEAAAAGKANEVLLRVGGHLKDEQPAAAMIGPAFIVKVVNKQGDVVQETTIGVVPNLPPPDESWIDV